MMRLDKATAGEVGRALRLDAKFFLDAGQAAYKRLERSGWPFTTVAETFGTENVRQPGRFERVPATSTEHGKPLLVPYDCFRYLPYSNEIASRTQTPGFPSLEIQRGWLLIVRSGRNLGPTAVTDAFLERFALSDDMIRIMSAPSDHVFYLAAFLGTPTGQALIRRDQHGSVISHLTPDQVSALRYPIVGEPLRGNCVAAFQRAFELREQARETLRQLSEEFLRLTGFRATVITDQNRARRFTVYRNGISDRFDAEPFAPLYSAYRRWVAGTPHAAIGQLAAVVKPPGRYKTLYVEDEQYGVKLLSGRNVAQFRPIAMKVMAHTAWTKPQDYLISKSMILLTCDGRAEENLADCALVRSDRSGWAASGHVIRLIPHADTNPGWLYLACASAPVQAVLKSLATGSVVDALSGRDVGAMAVPHLQTKEAQQIGDKTIQAWDWFADAYRLENQAVEDLESSFKAI